MAVDTLAADVTVDAVTEPVRDASNDETLVRQTSVGFATHAEIIRDASNDEELVRDTSAGSASHAEIVRDVSHDDDLMRETSCATAATLSSRLTLVRPRTHKLPAHVVWGFTIVTAMAVAFTNWCMVWFRVQLSHLRYDVVMRNLMTDQASLPGAILATAGLCCSYAFCAACLVAFVAPAAAGSGLPECKGYLNGSEMPGLFTVRSFVTRTLGVTLSTSAGFPIGREGPMVGIGGSIGFGLAHMFALPYTRKWVQMEACEERGVASPAMIVLKERFDYVKRIGSVLGASAGLACAFNAPIGGILYMFEEVTVTNWAPELTFRAFVCSVAAVLFSRAVIRLAGDHVANFLIFNPVAELSDTAWALVDVPLMMVLALLVGCISALFTKGLCKCWTFRSRMAKRLQRYQPWAKITEATLYCFVCITVFMLIPSLVECESEMHHEELGWTLPIRRLVAKAEPVPYPCRDSHQQNNLANIMLSSAEGTVMKLFERTKPKDAHNVQHLLYALLAYFPLACGMPGLAVPMGSFVPSLYIGALSGRLFGEVLQLLQQSLALEVTFAHAGVYCMVGSAAMLGGHTRMSLAIVALLVEASHDLSLVPVLMLGVSISTVTATFLCHHNYDHTLLSKKGVPFLESELPHAMEELCLTAVHICEDLPVNAYLTQVEPVDSIVQALETKFDLFPVFDSESCCIGLAPRERLEAAVKAHKRNRKQELGEDTSKISMPTAAAGSKFAQGRMSVSEQDLKAHREDQLHADIGVVIKKMMRRKSVLEMSDEPIVPVGRLMDPVPHILFAEAPLARFYPLFAGGLVSDAVVLSNDGQFLGVLSRKNLTDATLAAEAGKPVGRTSAVSAPKSEEELRSSEMPLEICPKNAADVLRSRKLLRQSPPKPKSVGSAKATGGQDDGRCDVNEPDQQHESDTELAPIDMHATV